MKKVIAVVLTALLFAGITGNVLAQEDSLVTRINGADRYATAVEVSKAGWDYSGVVVLARGDHFADALAGVPLAYLYEAPILLTKVDVLPAVILEEIQRLGASKVIILGGTGAVSEAVETELTGLNLEVQRVAGTDRFETAAEIAKLVAPYGAESAVVVNGLDFPDALSVAPYAAANGFPILLASKKGLSDSAWKAIDNLGVAKTLVIGGTGAISQEVMELLPNPQRIGGSDRFATSVGIAEYFQPESGEMFIATGLGYADAITGAALAARQESGMLLTGAALPQSVKDYLGSSDVEAVQILGGFSAVSAETENLLLDVLKLIGKNVELIYPAVLTSQPGSGQDLRYPCRGHVAEVLDKQGDYVQIQFGSKLGWIAWDCVQVTDKEPDKIRLGWQFGSYANNSFLQQPPGESGYNVYAPVMFYIDNSGLKMYSGRNYTANIKLAREQGYQVWLTIAQFGTSPNFGTEAIPWIISKALELDVDGINIDYEGMGSANRDAFTAFMDKLYTECKKYNLSLSVDVNRPSGNVYGASYDRKALGRVSDYVILMAYDEHWASSPQEGSVASHPWTRQSLELVLKEVPAEKLVLGMPFYTRNWQIREEILVEEDSVVVTGAAVNVRTEPATAGGNATIIFTGYENQVLRYVGKVEGENIDGFTTWYKVAAGEGEYGFISGRWSKFYAAGSYLEVKSVHSSSMGQKTVNQIIANYDPAAKTSGWLSAGTGNWNPMTNVSLEYDEKSGQNVVTWTCQNNYLNKIWLEDVCSLRKRVALAEEYGLAGLAAWSLDWMDAEVQLWNMIK